MSWFLTQEVLAGINARPLLRIASPYNRSAGASDGLVVASGASRRVAARLYRPIGSANKKSLGVLLENWYFDSATTTAGPGGVVNVIGCYIECNSVSVQITWSGNATPTMSNGQYDFMSDLVYPAQFGLSSFTRGTVARIRIELDAPNGSAIPCAGAVDLNDTCRQYDPAATSCTNLSGTGALTFSGTTTAATVPWCCLVGEDVNTSADAGTFIGASDSIFWQSSTQSYFMAALEGANVANQLISGLVVGRAGLSSAAYANDTGRISHLAKYANRIVSNDGTNDIPSITNTSIISNKRSGWAKWRSSASTHPAARPLLVIALPLLMKSTGTFTSLAGQTITANWNAGQQAELLDSLVSAQLGVGGGCDVYPSNLVISPNVMRGSASGYGVTDSDWHKWSATVQTTADGVHPNAAGASGTTGLGANLRVILLANF